jgi:TetR/AcrR family transcriptional regulator, transcriptional repressor for nem operon
MDAAEALILENGFAGTSLDTILERTGVTKGAFFHHFPSKTALARALVERYAAADRALLEESLARAERLSRDPLQQLLVFVGLIEEVATATDPHPGCLFASYVYEAQLFDGETHAVMQRALLEWRDRLGAKLREVAAEYPPRLAVNLDVTADAMTAVLEGAFIISRLMREPGTVAGQLREYRNYLELLFTPC